MVKLALHALWITTSLWIALLVIGDMTGWDMDFSAGFVGGVATVYVWRHVIWARRAPGTEVE
jgi:hypothetical protein